MRILSLLVVVAWMGVPSGPAGTARAAPDADVPEARQVVVRRAKALDQAILAAFGARTDASAGTAALVIDVTPHTQKQMDAIGAALRALDENPAVPRPWRIAALGRPFAKGTWSAGELSFRLGQVMDTPTDERNTVVALRRSLKTLDVRGGTVIYLADWRFEDEHGLEKLIRDLAGRRLAFGVVGSEAAFGRGWNDGVLDMRDRMQGGQLVLKDPSKQKRYDETIGRSPFGPHDKNAPWHGGDTAYPHVPYRFAGRYWQTMFEPSALRFGKGDAEDAGAADLEDLLERMGRKRETFESAVGRRMALPSAYGPHGLMRACAERGGRYVLWSWNPSHRASLEYDYARCDRFGPDLRSRSAIKKDVSRRPLARALLGAWHGIGSKFNALAEHVPPLDKGGTRPQPIDLLERSAATLHTMWMTKTMHTEFLRKAKHWRSAARSGAKRLDKALARVKEPLDAADRRYAADAELLRHILLVLSFELSEAIAVAEAVPDDAWQDDETYPGIRPTPWIQPGNDPEAIDTTDVEIQDPKLGERVKTARAAHLRRFGGTPFGLQVAANGVETWVLTKGRKIEPTGKPMPVGRTPGESEGTPAPPSPRPPGGGSSGGGPSTGGG